MNIKNNYEPDGNSLFNFVIKHISLDVMCSVKSSVIA